MALTERDRGLLRTVAEYGVLTTDHVRALCFPSASRARKRLRRLWQHGFLRRHVRPVRMGEGSAAFLYTLGRAGAQFASGNAKTTSRSRASVGEHSLRIIDFRVGLALALRHRTGLRFARWQSGKAFRFGQPVAVNHGMRVVPIVPDGFFTLAADGREFHYCLEVDRGTTDLGRLRAKFLAYLNLWQSRAASAKLGILSFRILYVTTTEKRLAHMLDALRGLQGAQRRLDLIALSCFNRYSLTHPERLLAPIFQTIGPDGAVQTARPFPAPPPVALPIVPGKPPVSEPDAGAR
ncbi:MAG: replication-relaxation family protein [Candidatus Zixiibacteriota bacterium]